MTNHDRYRHKRASSADAMRHVRNGDTIIVPAGVGEPPSLLTALSAQRLGFLDVKVLQILAMRKYAYLDPQTAGHVRHVALFFGGASRAGGQQGWIDFLPGYFSELPAQIERGHIAADVVFSMASPMDAHGYFAISLGADYTLAGIARARAVVRRRLDPADRLRRHSGRGGDASCARRTARAAARRSSSWLRR